MFADAFVLAADTARLSFNAKLLLFIHDLPIQRVPHYAVCSCAEINCKLIALIRDRLSSGSGSSAILLPANYSVGKSQRVLIARNKGSSIHSDHLLSKI